MNIKELKKIAKELEILENKFKNDYGLNRISGGFVQINMIDYNKEYIFINVKDGIQSDCTNSVNTEILKLDRKTIKLIN